MNINVSYDSTLSAAPAGFQTAVQAAVNFFNTTFTNNITVNITFSWAAIGGGLAQSQSYYYPGMSYSSVVAALATNASGIAALAHEVLPSSDPFALNSGNLNVNTAEAKALGLVGASSSTDGICTLGSNYTFNFNPNVAAVAGQFSAVGALEHEISEVLGRSCGSDGSLSPTALALFRYSAPGVIDTSGSYAGAYFSVDGGVTHLFPMGEQGSDLADWGSGVSGDALGYASSGSAELFSATDIAVMNAIGYKTSVAPTVTSATFTGAAIQPNGNGVLTTFEKAFVTIGVSAAVQVNVSGGSPTLSLNNGGMATYDAAKSTATKLVFDYTVLAGQNTADLAISSFNLNGAVVADGGGNALVTAGAVTNPTGILNTIAASTGSDTIYGNSAGVSDTLRGGVGNDTYVIYNATDVVSESPNEGVDTVNTSLSTYSLPFNVENLNYTGGGSFNGAGNSLTNSITGGSGNDTLDGAGGGDTLAGGLGNDTYYVRGSDDVVVEALNGGTDTVIESLSYYLLAANVENLTRVATPWVSWAVGNGLDNNIQGSTGGDVLFGGGGNDTIYCNGGNDDISGDAGNDVIYGGSGADTIRGGVGDDTYYIGSAADRVSESPGEGADAVNTTLTSFALPYNIENLTYSGSSAFSGTGNSLANVITGGVGNDTLDGAGGGDMLIGSGGNDTFYVRQSDDVVVASTGGNNTVYESLTTYLMPANIKNLFMSSTFNSTATGNGMNDTITGSAAGNYLDVRAGGLATLTGGGGADVFAFQAGKANGDVVTDFSGIDGQGDKLELHGYGAAWQGASITRTDATHWLVSSFDNAIHDTLVLSNGVNVTASDVQFLA